MTSERERMIRGDPYDPRDPELVAARLRARRLLKAYNDSAPDAAERAALLRELIGHVGADAWIEPPFQCDYGANITLGAGFYCNFNCVMLDVAPIVIGRTVLLGPGVHIYAATHPLDAATRRSGLELGAPVTIEDDVWIGGASVVCPGTRIGAGSVIGAGSIVITDIPPGVLAAGNPCRVIRSLGEAR